MAKNQKNIYLYVLFTGTIRILNISDRKPCSLFISYSDLFFIQPQKSLLLFCYNADCEHYCKDEHYCKEATIFVHVELNYLGSYQSYRKFVN
ncbi:hypothetical protein B9Z55_023635 [Caenorhabditis nigoni]|uniref:Uncharacterized protein n=1 Tax=Caenorhabditis nigoni TaxID=1611254 RepID=A0A2G5SQL7_9PELO|nr:hypothetical protein B9Z55_023635 [Caenorhabditis nigoni]